MEKKSPPDSEFKQAYESSFVRESRNRLLFAVYLLLISLASLVVPPLSFQAGIVGVILRASFVAVSVVALLKAKQEAGHFLE